MGSHIVDSELFKDQFSSAEMREIFSEKGVMKGWIDVEIALAKAEADLEIIPEDAAREIERNGNIDHFDLSEIKRGIDQTWHPLISFIQAYKALCNGGHGEYLHWGATTQDIMDTGAVLQFRSALDLIDRDLRENIHILREMAQTHSNTIMAGRTHGQHALPITFGYKVAVWIAEINRHLERLDQLKPRILTGNLSGAVGTMAFLGNIGLDVQQRALDQLGLNTPEISWHASRDRIAEVSMFLGMVGATFGKIAKEIIQLQKTEVAELEEPLTEESVGSSTMPQKRNPMACEAVFATSITLKAQVALSLDVMLQEHERDMGLWEAEWEFLPEMFMLTGGILRNMHRILSGLRVRDENMSQNLEKSEGLIMAEAVMRKVAEKLGRQRAHKIVYEIAMRASQSNESFADALKQNSTIQETVDISEIDNFLEPAAYTGLSEQLVESVLKKTRVSSAMS